METCELICNITKNIKDSISADTVIGTPIRGNGFTVIPICKSITGFACGGGEADGKATVKKTFAPFGAGGGGASVSPLGFLVMDDCNVRFIKIDGGDKWEDCLEGIIELFSH